MAFNNPYQIYPNQFYQQPNNYQNANSSIIWVQGEAGAKSYLVAPNTTVALWDSEDEVIYLKSSDASGMPSIKTLDYKVRNNNSAVRSNIAPNQDFVTKDYVLSMEDRIKALEGKIESLGASTKRTTSKKEVKDES